MKQERNIVTTIPQIGFARLSSIIGNPKAEPPIHAIIPVSKSSWWEGIKKGIYPKPIKLSERTTAWRWEDIHELIARLNSDKSSSDKEGL